MKKNYKKSFCLVILQFFSIALMYCTPNLPARTADSLTVPTSKHLKKIRKGIIEPSLGAAQFEHYLPQLFGKRVGLVVNHTSLVEPKIHLVDTLLQLGIEVKKVFAPEHGFRGDIDAGEHLIDSKDPQTGLPIVSLYGKNKKPTPEQLQDLDVIIFDIQDVGTRFYTYISTMHYAMEACAEQGKQLIVLDRPNPNGAYIDGPMLDPKLKSFVGMHPIPIVHGLTVGELALMINGEGWLENGIQCDLTVIPLKDYVHEADYALSVAPSPNLPNDLSVRLYPSLCLFEGTQISVGRGTRDAFQMIGAPYEVLGDFTFTPVSIVGMAKNPKYQDKLCYGKDFRATSPKAEFTLKYLIEFYQKYPDKANFFNGYFDTLVGTFQLKQQIITGMSEKQIRQTWQADLEAYKKLREKYLLYP